MPPKLGSSPDGAPQNAMGAASNSPASPSRSGYNQDKPRQDPTPPIDQPRPPEANRPAQGRDDEGVDYQDGDDEAPAFRKRFDEYLPRSAGRYMNYCQVSQIVRWDRGASVTFKVIDPGNDDDDGRQLEWGQTPPPYCVTGDNAAKSMEIWRRDFFGAYAAGGWTVVLNQSTGWGGWQASATKGKNGKPLPVPPYDRFFLECVDGVWVPTMLVVETKVDAGYEKYEKIVTVKPLLLDGRRVQAPAPWRVVSWIAEQYGWQGKDEAMNGSPVPVRRLAVKDFPRGMGGLPWWQEALRTLRDRKAAAGKPASSFEYKDDDIPF